MSPTRRADKPVAPLICKLALLEHKYQIQKKKKKKKREKSKFIYNRRDSLMVTHSTTNRPACGLSTAERTGSPVFHTLWSYMLEGGIDCHINRMELAKNKSKTRRKVIDTVKFVVGWEVSNWEIRDRATLGITSSEPNEEIAYHRCGYKWLCTACNEMFASISIPCWIFH